jgi:hypothetical protein
VALRLAIGRDGVGLELAQPATRGCMRESEVSKALPAVRYPVGATAWAWSSRSRRLSLASA